MPKTLPNAYRYTFSYSINGLPLKENSPILDNVYIPFFCLLVSRSSKKSGGRVGDLGLRKATEGSDFAFNTLDDSCCFGNALADSCLALFDWFCAAALALKFSTACKSKKEWQETQKMTVLYLITHKICSNCLEIILPEINYAHKVNRKHVNHVS